MRLVVSFSGGRTSAYMTHRILAEPRHDEIAVIFANTGLEHARTLDFIHNCDEQMGFATHWIEAVVHFERAGTTGRRVSYQTAARAGEPFADVIAKYGIPNKAFPHCTRELKQRPIDAYVRDVLGWSDYDTAIGIRADERRRVSPSATVQSIVYPLIDWWPTDKPTILDWWGRQAFDLGIPEHLGNCVTCWKKSAKKLLRVAVDEPQAFEFMARMEAEYPRHGPEFRKADGATRPDRVFFRERTSARDILRNAALVNPERLRREPLRPDEDGGCSESCELYPTERA